MGFVRVQGDHKLLDILLQIQEHYQLYALPRWNLAHDAVLHVADALPIHGGPHNGTLVHLVALDADLGLGGLFAVILDGHFDLIALTRLKAHAGAGILLQGLVVGHGHASVGLLHRIGAPAVKTAEVHRGPLVQGAFGDDGLGREVGLRRIYNTHCQSGLIGLHGLDIGDGDLAGLWHIAPQGLALAVSLGVERDNELVGGLARSQEQLHLGAAAGGQLAQNAVLYVARVGAVDGGGGDGADAGGNGLVVDIYLGVGLLCAVVGKSEFYLVPAAQGDLTAAAVVHGHGLIVADGEAPGGLGESIFTPPIYSGQSHVSPLGVGKVGSGGLLGLIGLAGLLRLSRGGGDHVGLYRPEIGEDHAAGGGHIAPQCLTLAVSFRVQRENQLVGGVNAVRVYLHVYSLARLQLAKNAVLNVVHHHAVDGGGADGADAGGIGTILHVHLGKRLSSTVVGEGELHLVPLPQGNIDAAAVVHSHGIIVADGDSTVDLGHGVLAPAVKTAELQRGQLGGGHIGDLRLLGLAGLAGLLGLGGGSRQNGLAALYRLETRDNDLAGLGHIAPDGLALAVGLGVKGDHYLAGLLPQIQEHDHVGALARLQLTENAVLIITRVTAVDGGGSDGASIARGIFDAHLCVGLLTADVGHGVGDLVPCAQIHVHTAAVVLLELLAVGDGDLVPVLGHGILAPTVKGGKIQRGPLGHRAFRGLGRTGLLGLLAAGDALARSGQGGLVTLHRLKRGDNDLTGLGHILPDVLALSVSLGVEGDHHLAGFLPQIQEHDHIGALAGGQLAEDAVLIIAGVAAVDGGGGDGALVAGGVLDAHLGKGLLRAVVGHGVGDLVPAAQVDIHTAAVILLELLIMGDGDLVPVLGHGVLAPAVKGAEIQLRPLGIGELVLQLPVRLVGRLTSRGELGGTGVGLGGGGSGHPLILRAGAVIVLKRAHPEGGVGGTAPVVHYDAAGILGPVLPGGDLRAEDFIDRLVVHKPGDGFLTPAVAVVVEVLGGIKAQVVHVLMSALAAGKIVELHLGGILAQELDIDLVVVVGALDAAVGVIPHIVRPGAGKEGAGGAGNRGGLHPHLEVAVAIIVLTAHLGAIVLRKTVGGRPLRAPDLLLLGHLGEPQGQLSPVINSVFRLPPDVEGISVFPGVALAARSEGLAPLRLTGCVVCHHRRAKGRVGEVLGVTLGGKKHLVDAQSHQDSHQKASCHRNADLFLTAHVPSSCRRYVFVCLHKFTFSLSTNYIKIQQEDNRVS